MRSSEHEKEKYKEVTSPVFFLFSYISEQHFYLEQSPQLITMVVNSVKVGAVQAEPVWLDLQGSVKKTIEIIKQAAKEGTNVLGFPMCFIPGYPL